MFCNTNGGRNQEEEEEEKRGMAKITNVPG